ncbi:uncharacterized protein CDAR_113061 [Caerostris darwini]|uniref:Uncharacterized protein n=1 Tax=Caerostris darwini TaxID=1538125 RepID=A0AAV4Q1E4_9ARAC|nr:uncharacterized protein CDAR_113061 [Caerostris darwini]
MESRRNVSLERSFQNLEAAASDATRILVRNINTEWQMLEKYKKLSTEKEYEKTSIEERIGYLKENQNILEKQLIGAERRIESSKKSNAELKRNLNHIRRQEEKSERDYTSDKQMLDDKVAYYQAKWQERYETHYAHKPLVHEYDKTKRTLADMVQKLKFLKSDLHECKAEIFKAKCERGKRNAEESGFYPLESFIIRLAVLGAEVFKLERNESQMLKEINILNQTIDNKAKELQNAAKNSKESDMPIGWKSVGQKKFFERSAENSVVRKEISSTFSTHRVSEDSILSNYEKKTQLKPLQAVVRQTAARQPVSEVNQQIMQEPKIRSRLEKLKLYTPQFCSPPDLAPKQIDTISDSRQMEKQENNPTIPGRFQKSANNFLTTKQKMSFQTSPIQEERMEPKSAQETSSHHSFLTYRFKELQNNDIENIPKENSSKEFKNFTKHLVTPSKRNLSKFFNSIEENEINLSNKTDMNMSSKGKGLPNDAVTQDRFIRGHQQNRFASNNSVPSFQEQFISDGKEYQLIDKEVSSKVSREIHVDNDKRNPLFSEYNSSKNNAQFLRMNKDKEILIDGKQSSSKTPQESQINPLLPIEIKSSKSPIKRNNKDIPFKDGMSLLKSAHFAQTLDNAETHRQHKLAKSLDMADVHQAARDSTSQENVMRHYNRNETQENYQFIQKDIKTHAPIQMNASDDQMSSEVQDINETENIVSNNYEDTDTRFATANAKELMVVDYEELTNADMNSQKERIKDVTEESIQEPQGINIPHDRISNRSSSHHEEAAMEITENEMYESNDEADNHMEETVASIVESNPSNSQLKQNPHDLNNDQSRVEVGQIPTDNVQTNLTAKHIEKECNDEIKIQTKAEIPNYENKSKSEIMYLSSQENNIETESPLQPKFSETVRSDGSELIEKKAIQKVVLSESINYPNSCKSTSSSEVYYTPRSCDSKLQTHSSSPAISEMRTPVSQNINIEAASPFDFEKHVKILGELKSTPNFRFQNRDMYRAENKIEEASHTNPQETNEAMKDIFSAITFFQNSPSVNENTSFKPAENEKSKSEESGFLSFALEDYLSDSPSPPAQVGKEKSMFSFACDSPKGAAVKSPTGFFSLFTADTQESTAETNSNFVFNFGGGGSEDKAKSPDQASSFKFLF